MTVSVPGENSSVTSASRRPAQRPVPSPSKVSSRWLPNSSTLTSAVSLYLWMLSSHAVRIPKAVRAKLAFFMASGSPSLSGAYTCVQHLGEKEIGPAVNGCHLLLLARRNGAGQSLR